MIYYGGCAAPDGRYRDLVFLFSPWPHHFLDRTPCCGFNARATLALRWGMDSRNGCGPADPPRLTLKSMDAYPTAAGET